MNSSVLGSPGGSPLRMSITSKKQSSSSAIPTKFKKYYSTSTNISLSDGSQSIFSKQLKLKPSELHKSSVVNAEDYPVISMLT
jgi:hypothetical protein